MLTGGAGDDILIGGPGIDRFVFSGGFGKDTIVDLTLETEKIAIPGGSFSELHIASSATGAVVALDLGAIAVFGVHAADLTAASFDFT